MTTQAEGTNKRDFGVEDLIPDPEQLTKSYANPEFAKAWDAVKDQLDKQLVLAFLGTASSGKTSGIKALFNVDLGNIHPIPGSTTKVIVFKVADNFFVADAPGFGDIRTDVSQKAKDLCDDVDIFVYIINSEGGYKEQEREDYHRLVALNRQVLVVLNKIDLIRPHQRDEFIEDQRKKMGVAPGNFVPAAFDPLPQISETSINVDAVQDWIQGILESKAKDLLFAKYVRGKDRICERWIKTACVTAAGIGALPIPGSDYVALTAVQSALLAKIAHLYGHTVTKQDTAAFIGQALAGGAGKQFFRYILNVLKGVGWLPGGVLLLPAVAAIAGGLAASITYGLGKAAQSYYRGGMSIPEVEVQDIFKRSAERYEQRK
jgi:GTPase